MIHDKGYILESKPHLVYVYIIIKRKLQLLVLDVVAKMKMLI